MNMHAFASPSFKRVMDDTTLAVDVDDVKGAAADVRLFGIFCPLGRSTRGCQYHHKMRTKNTLNLSAH